MLTDLESVSHNSVYADAWGQCIEGYDLNAIIRDSSQHPTPLGATIYYWHGGLLLLSNTLILDRPISPIAATLRIALKNPYQIEVDGQEITTLASLVGSNKVRRRVSAIDSDVALFYFPIEWPEHAGLRRRLGSRSILDLDIELFKPVIPRIRKAFSGELSAPQIKELSQDTLRLLVSPGDTSPIDDRIVSAFNILIQTPLDQFNIDYIASQVHLSPSRLRSLFKEQIGYPIGEYARWTSIWKAIGYWTPGSTFTDAAIAAGFFDLAHVDKTFVELFGMSPSLATDPRFVKVVNCDL